MKTVIVYASRHHGNTKKLVEAIAKAHAVDVIDADLQQTADLKNYDRIGFASGVAFGKYYPPLLTFMEKNLPAGKEVFFLHTAGDPKEKHNAAAKNLAEEKDCTILGTYCCKGYDTFGLFKLIGGINKRHPKPDEIAAAVRFFETLGR
ncbi:MAG: flavodoxin domain-containing protein [Christensenellales bacterium]|jgi:flavodoxin